MFSDPAPTVVPIAHPLPKLEAAIRVTTKTIIDLIPNNAGNPVATLDLPLPIKAVGKAGYVLWNWRKESPSATLTTEGTATPTKSIQPAFADTISAVSFNGFNPQPGPPFSTSGKLTFRINGKDGVVDKADGRHGSVAQGVGGAEELQLQPRDDAEHRLTLVLVGGLGDASVRVSVRGKDGATEIMQYVQTMTADNVLQFRFTGPVGLRVEVTSAPFRRSDNGAMDHLTPIGPAALFLD